MSGNQVPPDAAGQQATPAQGSTHEHLYRVVIGEKAIVRYCERCGRTWLAAEWPELLQPKNAAYWIAVREPTEISGKRTGQSDQAKQASQQATQAEQPSPQQSPERERSLWERVLGIYPGPDPLLNQLDQNPRQ